MSLAQPECPFLSTLTPHPPIHPHVPPHLQRERQGDIVDKGLFRAMTQMLVDLGQPGRCPAWGSEAPLSMASEWHASCSRLCALPLYACLRVPWPYARTCAGVASSGALPLAWHAAVYFEDFEAPFLERTAEFYRAEVGTASRGGRVERVEPTVASVRCVSMSCCNENSKKWHPSAALCIPRPCRACASDLLPCPHVRPPSTSLRATAQPTLHMPSVGWPKRWSG